MAGDQGKAPDGLGCPGDGDVVGALSRADAARAVRAYPVVVRTGPVFAVVEQGSRGRWRVLRTGEFTRRAPGTRSARYFAGKQPG